MARQNRRVNGTIDRLPPPLKDTVDQMLLSGESYREIVGYLSKHEVALSQQAVSKYARRFLATAQQLRVAQENFRMILTETQRYPNLDPVEAILRLASQKVFDAVAEAQDEEFNNMPVEKLLKQATALARAAAYKKRVDIQVKDGEEIALDSNQTLLYEALKKRNPRLYSELLSEIRKIREAD